MWRVPFIKIHEGQQGHSIRCSAGPLMSWLKYSQAKSIQSVATTQDDFTDINTTASITLMLMRLCDLILPWILTTLEAEAKKGHAMLRCASEATTPHTHTHLLPVSNKHDSLTLHLGSIHLDRVPDKCEEERQHGNRDKESFAALLVTL